VADNELLTYDSGTSKWINQTSDEMGFVLDTGDTMTGALVITDPGGLTSPKISLDANCTLEVSNGDLSINNGAGADVNLFDGATGAERPYLRVYGYATDAGALRYAEFSIGTWGNMWINCQQGSIMSADQLILQTAGLALGRYDTDNVSLTLGAAEDASVYYDGTNLLINPKLVGTGYLGVLGSLKTDGGRIVNTTRVTTTYTALVTDNVIFCDTDGGAFTITLPAGVEGQHFKIINCGSSVNQLTIDGDGAETVWGGLTAILNDGDIINLHYNATEGWW